MNWVANHLIKGESKWDEYRINQPCLEVYDRLDSSDLIPPIAQTLQQHSIIASDEFPAVSATTCV